MLDIISVLGLILSILSSVCYVGYMLYASQPKSQKFIGRYIDIWPTLIAFAVISGMFLYAHITPFTITLIKESQTDDNVIGAANGHFYSSRLQGPIYFDNVPLALGVNMSAITAMAAEGDFLYLADNPSKTVSILRMLVFQQSFQLPFYPNTLAVDNGTIYVTGTDETYTAVNYIYIIAGKRMSQLTTFNNGDTFKRARGLVIIDHLLYVADYDRILVFQGVNLIREIAPVFHPQYLAAWADLLVVTQTSQAQLFQNGLPILTLFTPSYNLAVYNHHLYIIDPWNGKLRVYSG